MHLDILRLVKINRTNMLTIKKLNMRIIHRYLGFFLAGIMAVYALSGIVLIYRHTDVFKVESLIEEQLKTNLNEKALGKKIKIKELHFELYEGDVAYFKQGSYDSKNGHVVYTKNELHFALKRLTKLHKADTDSPLYWLNIFFGASLLFFSVSAFWMFKPKSKIFRNGIMVSGIGFVFALLMLFW
ncbi:MAG: hypothetical protein ACI93R_001386 [Flavobacteriales bacterium]